MDLFSERFKETHRKRILVKHAWKTYKKVPETAKKKHDAFAFGDSFHFVNKKFLKKSENSSIINLMGGDAMATKYPIILVHGLALRGRSVIRVLKAFRRIEKVLDDLGYDVFVADNIDGFGSIESNAEKLKEYVLEVCRIRGAEKVNIIAHSKGGLDSKYMIMNLGMEDKVASLTTLCTPHRGSIIASKIWSMPRFITRFLAFFINNFYKLLGDKNPDAYKACEQLKKTDTSEETINFSDKVYCQSFSTTLRKSKDCFLMGIPMLLYRKFEEVDNDGLVSVESAKFGNYKGSCLDISVSHSQIVAIGGTGKKLEKVYQFYKKLCEELSEMGF